MKNLATVKRVALATGGSAVLAYMSAIDFVVSADYVYAAVAVVAAISATVGSLMLRDSA